MTGPGQQSPGGAGSAAARLKYEREYNKTLKTKTSLGKIDNENTVRKLTLSGDQLALLELEKQFDVERIGLFAALNQATDGETQMRLLSKIAIYDQNEALAGMIAKANLAGDALTAFKDAIVASLKALTDMVQAQIDALNAQFGGGGGGGGGGYGFNNPENPGGINPPNYGVIDNPLNFGDFQLGERDTFRDYMNGTNVTVNIAGSLVGQRDLQDAVVQAVNAASSSGTGPGFSRIS